jgi:hypothetical protein
MVLKKKKTLFSGFGLDYSRSIGTLDKYRVLAFSVDLLVGQREMAANIDKLDKLK